MSDINFSKLTWENLPARTTALSAQNLNRIENGIADSVDGVNANSHSIAELQTRISQIANGSPTPVSTVAEMTDESAVYLYMGSESGYTAGNWYYYNGSAWTSGGTYGGAVTDTTLSISGKAADAKAVGDALALKADSSDVTALGTRVTAVEDDVDALDDDIDGIKEALFKTDEYSESVTKAVAVGDYKNTADLLAFNIPAGQTFTIRFGTDATHGNITVWVRYSDDTSSALTYNASVDTDLTYTKDKEIVLFRAQVYGGFTSTGTLNVSASYAKHNENSVEEQLETLFTDKADADDVTALGARVTTVEGDVSDLSDRIDDTEQAIADKADASEVSTLGTKVADIEESLYKTITHEESVTREIAVGDFKNTADLLAFNVPAGQTFTIHLNTDATHGNIIVWAKYSDDTASALTYNASIDTDLTYTKDKEIVLFKLQVYSGFTSAGTLSFSCSYIEKHENSIQAQIENLESNFGDTNIIYSADSITVDGSVTPSIRIVDITDGVVVGYDYMLEFESIDIENNHRPCVVLSTRDANGDAVQNVYLTDTQRAKSIRATSGVTRVSVTLYPNYWGTAVTAVYHGMKLSVNGSPVKKLDKFVSLYSEDVPPYYFENGYIQSKAARINELTDVTMSAPDGGAALFFITDAHWTQNDQQSLKLISYLKKNCRIPILFDGGDTDLDGVSEEYCDGLRKAFPHEIHHTMGNHDYYYRSDTDGKAYMAMDAYGTGKRWQIGNVSRHYYYVDYPQTRIRYIVLNSNSVSTDDHGAASGYEPAQCTWLQDVALATVPDGYGVVVIGHVFATLSGIYVSRVLDVLDTAKANGVDVICCLQGHLHYDYFPTTTGGIPIITTNSDKRSSWIDTHGYNREPWQTLRTKGTITEQCFDVHFINRTNRTITTVRIGAPITELLSISAPADGDTTYTADTPKEEQVISY